MVVAEHHSAVDLDHQRLEFVAQIAHGGDARHPGSAFQGVQLTLQFLDPQLVLAVAIPCRQGDLRRLEQFSGFFTVDIRDLAVEFFRRRYFVGGPLGARIFAARVFRQNHQGRRHGLALVGESRVECGLELVQSLDQPRLSGEECGRLVDVRHHVVDFADRIRQDGKTFVGQSMAAVVYLAQVLVQRFGDPYAVARFGHFRAAAQGVHCAIDRLRQIMRRGLRLALLQVLADLHQMAGSLLAVNVMQQRIHGRRGFGRERRGPPTRRQHHRRRRRVVPDSRHGGCGAVLGREIQIFLLGLAAVGVAEGAGHQRLHRHGALPAAFQLLHQLRQGGDRVAQQRHHSGGARQRLVDDAVQ